MANPVWSPGQSSVSTKPFKVTDSKMYGQEVTVSVPGTVNPYLESIVIKTTKSGQVQYVINNTTFNSIQEIADETLIANAGYSATTTAALQSATQNALNTIATNTGSIPTGTLPQPANPAAGQTPTQTPGSASPGPNYNPEDTKFGAFESALPDLQKQVNPKPNSYGIWTYPKDLANQDRVFIQQLQYVTADISTSEQSFGGSLSNREYDINQSARRKILGSVTLPITNNLSESIEVGWGDDRLSSIAAGLMAGGVSATDLASEGNLFAAIQRLGGTAGSALANPGIQDRIRQFLTARTAAGLIGGLGIQINPEAYIARRTGVVPNPNLELLFNGPKLKGFGLVFKLVARSSDEAHEIRNIIKFFKKGMAPIKGINSETNFFLGTPNVFKVQFKPSRGTDKDELLSLPQFKTCALVRCEVNYTPDGVYAAYEDPNVVSQPIAVTLQLGFAELTPVYNNDYELPSRENQSVGPDRNLFENSKIEIATSGPTNQPSAAEQERLADTTGRVPNTPQRPRVSGGQQSAASLGARISNIERYESAVKAGFKGTYQEWFNQGQ